MKRILLFALSAVLAASLVFAQAGPKEQTKKKKKARPDTTKAKAKPSEPAKAKPKPKAPPEVKPKTESKPKPKPKPKKKVDDIAGKKATPKPARPKAKTVKQPVVSKPKQRPAVPEPKKNTPLEAVSRPKPKPSLKRTTPDAPLAAGIGRAVFTTAIEAHEPVGAVDSLSTETERIHFFTELVGMRGARITHRWLHDGEIRAEVPITVRSSRYRAFSSKTLLPSWTGRWTVEVVDSTGHVLGTKRFAYYRAVRD